MWGYCRQDSVLATEALGWVFFVRMSTEEVVMFQPGVLVHAFNPSTQEADAGRSRSSRSILVYRASSRTASISF